MKKRPKKYITLNKTIMERWDYPKNNEAGILPDNLTESTHINAHFICPICNHSWFGELRDVARYNGGCSVCAEKRREGYRQKAMVYCKNNNLSTDKLLEQELYIMYGTVHFAQPMPPSPPGTGLERDYETGPKTTLIYYIETGEFEQTEYTDKYLCI